MAKHSSTLKTIVGFIRSVAARALPFLSRSKSLDDIYNFLAIENVYSTSGQPSEPQFQLIKDAGVELVVNLAPTSVLENSVIEEAQILNQLGLEYVHIPVDFKNPTDDDFERFVSTVRDRQNVWVHCAANMRVSAFTYRYRTEVLHQDAASAKADLEKIWEPVGVWAEFVKR